MADEVTEDKSILVNYFVAEEGLSIGGEKDGFIRVKFKEVEIIWLRGTKDEVVGLLAMAM